MAVNVVAPEGFAGAFIIFSSLCGFAWAVYNYGAVAAVNMPNQKGQRTQLNESTQLKASGTATSPKVYAKLVVIYDQVDIGAKAFLYAEYKYIAVFMVVFGGMVFGLLGSAGNCGKNEMSHEIQGEWMTCAKDASGAFPEDCTWHTADGSCWQRGGLSAIAFLVGSATSVVSGYIGMRIAVYANARTALQCEGGTADCWAKGFRCAFQAGSVMGFSLCGLALIVLYFLIYIFNGILPFDGAEHGSAEYLFEAIAGYGLGGSSIAMFGRVGGGIYTKAADVGADLVGKVDYCMNEDDARNCATIADNVGDNVGDIAGMGADLFGSFAEASCAALVVASVSPELSASWTAMLFPLYISAGGIITCIITTLFALYGSFPVHTLQAKTDSSPGKFDGTASVFGTLKWQLGISTILMTPMLFFLSYYTLPEDDFCIKVDAKGSCLQSTNWFKCCICACAGLWGGLIIGVYTEFMTSYEHEPTQEVAKSTQTGAATNIIFGLALGYKSCVVPILVLAISIYTSFTMADMYGIALTALGMLSTLSVGLSIDAYGPITDNAGGLAEMSSMHEDVRNITDVLDAAGNTTAAIGKGFAIGSAALVSLALFGAFVTRCKIEGVDILQPITFAGLLVGAMLPYWFTAMTMKSVGVAAKKMVEHVRQCLTFNKKHIFQLDKVTGEVLFKDGMAVFLDEDDVNYKDVSTLKDHKGLNYYEGPIKIATDESLNEMIAPGALVMFTPIIVGWLFGVHAVTGLLAGGMTSGVQMAISQSNTGGAWDNAKKWVEKEKLLEWAQKEQAKAESTPGYESKASKPATKKNYAKGSECHKASVVGDTVGDPLKDTSGPALNILMKLMAIVSLVFAPFIVSHSICGSIGTC